MPRMLAPMLLALAAVGCRPPTPGPQVQALVNVYAPDLELGSYVSSAAQRRYKLQTAPYTGYWDGSFRSMDGVSELTIRLDRVTGDAPNETNSPWARIEAVTLKIPDSASNTLVYARIRQALGTPKVRCHHAAPNTRWHQSYWPGEQGRGVLLFASRGPKDTAPGASGADPVGSGWVTFGARAAELDAPGYTEACG